MRKTRVLVVDDSPLIRRFLSDMLVAEPDLEVVGLARNGEEGVAMAESLKPDVVTLDVEMPRMDGLTALKHLVEKFRLPVVMCSSLTSEGTAATLEALQTGAVDFIVKPRNGSPIAIHEARTDLVAKVRAARFARVGLPRPKVVTPSAASTATDRVVIIAASTGGPRALATLFEGLPKDFHAPVFIVQHMPVGFISGLAKRLTAIGTIPCREAEAGDALLPNQALIAPAGIHSVITPEGRIALRDDPTVHGVRPAADPLFISAAAHFGGRCVAAVLTGMGKDGADGARFVHRAGGTVFAEAESSCVVYGMPRAAVAMGGVDEEIPIERMGSAIAAAVAAPRRLRRAS